MRGLFKRGKRNLSFLCLVFCLFPAAVLADEVGRFIQVEGKVDLLRHGKPAAILVKKNTRAEEKDAVKTEALSRAQIQFLDASTLMVAPLSQITIESYMYDSHKRERGALCRLSRGLVHLIVNPMVKLEKKEFLIKTKTATMGIRGTDFYILLGPDFTDVFVKSGKVVAISHPQALPKPDTHLQAPPQISNLIRRTAIQAAIDNRVVINSMEASRLVAGQPPSPVVRLHARHFHALEGLMHIGLPPKFGDSSNPGQLLEKISQSDLSLPPPPPPPPPSEFGPSFPGTGIGGGGGGIASPFS